MSRILLGASASAALHKACDLASKLTQDGHRVRAVLTARAARLVSPQLFEAVTGEPASTDEFAAERRTAMDHIELADWSELVLVAPCTADLVARLATGQAGDLLSTVVLATPLERPRLLCPAMNPRMYAHPAVRRNFDALTEDGWQLLEPEEGHMACGVHGQGRLPEVDVIRAAVRASLPG